MSKYLFLGSLLGSIAFSSAALCQNFNTPTQTSLTAIGNTQRYAVGSAVVNGNTYVAYTASNGRVHIARDSGGNLQFGNDHEASSTDGIAVTANGNPALAYDSSSNRLWMVMVRNGSVILYNTTNPDQGGFYGGGGIAGGADASPSIAAQNGTVYVGYHQNSGQTTAVCYLPAGNQSYCATPQSGGSTYGPALALFNGQLWTVFQSNNSAHSLYYFRSSLNADGSIANFSLGTDAASDQTSAQPAALAVSSDVLLVGFRSNDASTAFLNKSYHASSNSWTGSTNNNYSISGAPSLVAAPGTTATNLFVGKNSPYYIYTSTSYSGF